MIGQRYDCPYKCLARHPVPASSQDCPAAIAGVLSPKAAVAASFHRKIYDHPLSTCSGSSQQMLAIDYLLYDMALSL